MRRRKPEPNWERHRLLKRDLDRLAVYNAEVHRGILHSSEYDEEMVVLQERFQAAQIEAFRADPNTVRFS